MRTQPSPVFMNIAQLANITGMPLRSIRRYAELGLIGNRDEAGLPEFSQGDIHSLKIFKLAYQCGYSVQDILKIVDAKNHNDHNLLESALSKLEQRCRAQRFSQQSPKADALRRLSIELDAFIASP